MPGDETDGMSDTVHGPPPRPSLGCSVPVFSVSAERRAVFKTFHVPKCNVLHVLLESGLGQFKPLWPRKFDIQTASVPLGYPREQRSECTNAPGSALRPLYLTPTGHTDAPRTMPSRTSVPGAGAA